MYYGSSGQLIISVGHLIYFFQCVLEMCAQNIILWTLLYAKWTWPIFSLFPLMRISSKLQCSPIVQLLPGFLEKSDIRLCLKNDIFSWKTATYCKFLNQLSYVCMRPDSSKTICEIKVMQEPISATFKAQLWLSLRQHWWIVIYIVYHKSLVVNRPFIFSWKILRDFRYTLKR